MMPWPADRNQSLNGKERRELSELLPKFFGMSSSDQDKTESPRVEAGGVIAAGHPTNTS